MFSVKSYQIANEGSGFELLLLLNIRYSDNVSVAMFLLGRRLNERTKPNFLGGTKKSRCGFEVTEGVVFGGETLGCDGVD